MEVENWVVIGTWFGALAELIVAGVIYAELREGRTLKAFEAVFDDKVYFERGKLYETFLSGPQCELDERQREFLRRIAADAELRSAVDTQIKQFSWLGYLLHSGLRRLLPRKFEYGPKKMLLSISHIMAPLAVMFVPYIQLKVKHKGRQFARHFTGLAMACLPLTYEHGIELFGKDHLGQGYTLKLGREDLEATRTALQALL